MFASPLDRRAFLTALGTTALGAAGGFLAARGLGAGGLGAPPPQDFDATLRALVASLSPLQREHVLLPADHPSRQIDNTIAVIDRPHLGTLLAPAQRALVDRLYAGMLSERGRACLAGTIAVEGRLDGCVLAVYGDPARGDAQAVISGGHLLVRGGARAMGAAFGGGVAYGHQVGNRRWRVEGNSFAWHGDAANRLYGALAPAERARAIVARPPHELVLQPQGAGGRFDGARIGALSEAAQAEAARLVDAVFSCYPDAERAEAHACLEAQGGLGALHFAVYETHGFYPDMRAWGELAPAERAARGDPYWQVWRVEGPGAVLHFQGSPHVHAYVHVVRDPARANLGEPLGRVAATLEGEPMRALLEAALRRATGEALAYSGPEVHGRFCAGEVTTGLAWSLDPYGNRVVVASLPGRATAAPLRERLAAGGVAVDPDAVVRIATTEYVARRTDWLGEPEAVEAGPTLLRDALVAHLRAGGLPPA
jgi:hypothetical protein